MNKEYKNLVVAFSGPSNSGKTTLITNISNILRKSNFKVCILKHDPKDKATFDIEGKDSHRFYNTGADVAVVSPNRTTLFKHETTDIDNIIELFGKFDYLLVEGLKTLPLPRISVFRNKLDESYFNLTNAIAFDDTIDSSDIPSDIDKLDLNDPENIISWIEKYAKRV